MKKMKDFDTEHTKTKFTKWTDDKGSYWYSLVLPDGTCVDRVSLELGLYLHQQERKVMMLNREK